MAEKNHRMCVSCRQLAHKDQLWRIVRSSPTSAKTLREGEAISCGEATRLTVPHRQATTPSHSNWHIQIDEGMGRSAYVCQTAGCVQSAHQKKRLNRALRTTVPDEIYTLLSDRLPSAATGPISAYQS